MEKLLEMIKKNKLVILIILVIYIIINLYSIIRYGYFTLGKPCPIPLNYVQIFQVSDETYIIVSKDTNGYMTFATEYNTKTNKFTVKPKIAKGLKEYGQIIFLDNKFLFTQKNKFNEFYLYNPIIDKNEKILKPHFNYSYSQIFQIDDENVFLSGIYEDAGKQKWALEIYNTKEQKFRLFSDDSFRIVTTISLKNAPTILVTSRSNRQGQDVYSWVYYDIKQKQLKNIDTKSLPKLENIYYPASNTTIKPYDDNRFIIVALYRKVEGNITKKILCKLKDDKIDVVAINDEKPITSPLIGLNKRYCLMTGGIAGWVGFLQWPTKDAYLYDMENNKIKKIKNTLKRYHKVWYIELEKKQVMILGETHRSKSLTEIYHYYY